ncbi:hypothetical protein UFOVP529_42 [uncultured Caudovirales phage]|uniref:Uncharacterized protein n=1 Tax=uncultured Caudovirales phage TaxID=2100421 RepID=A0A6J5REU7_9CAUD|nr:hypothetical protein UFOVP529_42 [uncultured Caudovirales phage]CAB4190733.1 hypothetical protein UFOVP1191_100 [uncultured Caudovirales phage]CAB4194472.1 hypothetical protein UFOVP1252_78 [uncultured Caudovirales phage]
MARARYVPAGAARSSSTAPGVAPGATGLDNSSPGVVLYKQWGRLRVCLDELPFAPGRSFAGSIGRPRLPGPPAARLGASTRCRHELARPRQLLLITPAEAPGLDWPPVRAASCSTSGRWRSTASPGACSIPGPQLDSSRARLARRQSSTAQHAAPARIEAPGGS